MSGYIDKAVSALLARGSTGIVETMDGALKIDITHADTDEHTLTKAAMGVEQNVVMILALFNRISGSSSFKIRTTAAGNQMTVASGETAIWPVDDTGVFRYNLGAANDDWDVHLMGTWKQGVILG